MRSVVHELPQYDYCFFGDTRNLPYGDKTEAEIFELTKTGVEELFNRDCVLVIIACNTASAQTLRKLQDTWMPETYPDRRILGVIVPTVEEIIDSGKSSATLIATKRTVDSKKYEVELNNRSDHPIELNALATPELVPFIELNEIDVAAEAAISRLDNEGGEEEVIVLGCTHYTELKEKLRKRYPEKLILSQDEIIPTKLKLYLDNHPEIVERLTSEGVRDIHLTEHRADYDRIMGQFLGGVYVEE